MGAIRLAVRALYFRKGLTAALVLVAALTAAGAVIAPTYARAGQESMVRGAVAEIGEVSPATRRISISYGGAPPAEGSVGVSEMDRIPALRHLASAERFLGQRRLDRFYAKPVAGASAPLADSTVTTSKGPVSAEIRLGWRRDQCAHLVMTSGSCPTRAGEVALAAGIAERNGIRVGDRLAYKDRVGFRVSGLYDIADRGDPYWAGREYLPRPTGIDEEARWGVGVVAKAGVARFPSYEVFADRMLKPGTVTYDAVAGLRAMLTNLQAGHPASPGAAEEAGAAWRHEMAILDVLKDLDDELTAVDRASLIVVAQLFLLAWFVMYLLVAGGSELREREFALAKLRGYRMIPTLGFAVVQPLLVLVAAAPIGVLLGWLSVRAMRGSLLPADVGVALPSSAFATLGIAFAGGVVAAVLACLGLVRRRVADQLAGSRRRRAGRVGRIVVAALALVLAGVGVYELSILGPRATSSGLALLTPGLIALAVGVAGSQGVQLLASLWARVSARSNGLGRFLAARRLARRNGNVRLVALLAIACASALFAGDAFLASSSHRDSLARMRAGAFEARPVTAPPGDGKGGASGLMAAVRRADPGGRHAMAVAITTPVGGRGLQRRLAVDAERFGSVAAWHPTWGGSAAAVARWLRAPAVRPVRFRGSELAVEFDVRDLRSRGPVRLEVELETSRGTVFQVLDFRDARRPGAKTTLRNGSSTFVANVPECRDGCLVRHLGVARFAPDSVRARLVVRDLRIDGRRIDAGLDEPTRRWRASLALSGGAGGTGPGLRVGADPAGLRIDVAAGDDYQLLRVTTRDAPIVPPAVVSGPGATASPDETVDAGVFRAYDRADPLPDRLVSAPALDGQQRPYAIAGTVRVLPILGVDGVVTDLRTALRDFGTPLGRTRLQVWLAPGTPPSVIERLESAGVRLGSPIRLDEERRSLDHEGSAVALSILLVVAVILFVLTLGAVALLLLLSARQRSYEAAALSALGVGRRTTRWSDLLEICVLVGSAMVLALVGASVMLRYERLAVPRLASSWPGPELLVEPSWPRLLLVAGLMALVAGIVGGLALLGSRVGGVPDRLREARP